ncbi:alkaline phosphatase family protein [Pyxidicoccus trucidator]|uniref:alkaline phosphatase family protein n=1 Tax=Pyxidicoccus trucidator TaxID=2709662 RepID=UPI0013DB298F|nr:alkaline phosphatase family protein [Pyxidicoccus trucidator]
MRDHIQHIVHVMFENRGFDSVLGYLYRRDELPHHHLPQLRPGEPAFHGLDFLEREALANTLKDDSGRPVRTTVPAPGVRAMNNPGANTHEDYEHVNVQLYGKKENPAPGAVPEMKGFLQDFSTRFSLKWDARMLERIDQVLRAYTPADLPVLNGLARRYAVSDAWFSSVPTQTNANRAFALAGTSLGLVDNGFLAREPKAIHAPLADDTFDTDTVWNVMERAGRRDWSVYCHDNFPPLLSSVPYTRRIFPRLEKIERIDSHFQPMARFFDHARSGRLPAFTYLEPSWAGEVMGHIVNGNDYHPPVNVTRSELFLRQVVDALSTNRAAWEQTLLIITFDEHGGTYDHVPPPWGARPPWGREPAPHALQHGFGFDRYGVRVPAILVSPWVEEGTVFRAPGGVPFDHTSVPATVLEWMGIPREQWTLGQRVLQAPTFDFVLTRATPRQDAPFAPTPHLPPGTPLRYGQPFRLRHSSGAYVTAAQTSYGYTYPSLGAGPPVSLELRLGFGEVQDGATVQLLSTENALERNNCLGAWRDRKDCYYYQTDDSRDFQQQQWEVRREGPGSGPLRYGDTVTFANRFSDFAGQRLARHEGWLTTRRSAADTWVLEAPAVTFTGDASEAWEGGAFGEAPGRAPRRPPE